MKDYVVIYVLGGVIAVLVIAMSLFFIRRSVRRAKEIGMDMSVIRNVVRSSALFSVVPSVPIVIGIGIMMQYLGLGLSWIRLEVIGALQYELIAMNQVVSASDVIGPNAVATALVVMTVSILSGLLFNALFYRKYEGRLSVLQERDGRRMSVVSGAMLAGLFSGILSALTVAAISTIGKPVVSADTGVATYGEVVLLTFASSAIIMSLCGLLIKVAEWRWLESYALPITIVGSLVVAYVAVNCFM